MCSEIVNRMNSTMVKATPYMVAIFLENRLAMATRNRIEVVTARPMGISTLPQRGCCREFVFLIVALEAQHQHAQGFEGEAPDHAERVGFAQQVERRRG